VRRDLGVAVEPLAVAYAGVISATFRFERYVPNVSSTVKPI
jgi:hypothetical protein